ncbi:MAG: NAD-dependent epimerase/dehydratase family protein [Thaumarchaeota archaeon]|nr:NAD-dependent epimerase/dehydratase family protein [Nitrososphaerota archaeon]
MRVLVTGAAGFYGSNFVNILLNDDKVESIVGLDTYMRSEDFPLDPFNIIEDKNALAKKFTMLKQDYRDLTAKSIDDLNVDAIVHFAALVSIPESMDKPWEYFNFNEYGVFKLTQELLKTKTQPFFVFASSPEVYGDPVHVPMDVDHITKPKSTYAVTKLAGESHVRVIHLWYKYPTCTIRNFNTYGENQSNTYRGYPAVVPAFITKALLDEPIVVHNDGEQTRDLTYVKDAVRAYAEAIRRKEGVKGMTFNIGTGVDTSIKELAEKIKKLAASKSQIVFKKGRPADLPRLVADIKLTTEVLGWVPKFTLEQGLEMTIAWYRKVLHLLQTASGKRQ